MQNAASKGVDAVKEQAKGQVNKARGSTSGIRVLTTGYPFREIVGESNYYAAIAKIAGKKGGEVIVDGVLSREPSNKFDSNAVKLSVGGQTVGYVPREENQQFHALLDTAVRAGQPVIVPTRVLWMPERNIGTVTFDCAEPAFAWPVNPLPSEYPLWPAPTTNRPKKVSIAEDAQAGVLDFLNRAYDPGKCAGFVRLASEAGTNRVTVYFEQHRIGELSAQSSKDMIGVIQQVQANGRWVYALAHATGNRMSAEITISTKTVTELTEPELTALVGSASQSAPGWAPPTVG